MHEFMLEWAAAWLRAVAFPVVKLLEQQPVGPDDLGVEAKYGTVTGRLYSPTPGAWDVVMPETNMPQHGKFEDCPVCKVDYAEFERRLAEGMTAGAGPWQ